MKKFLLIYTIVISVAAASLLIYFGYNTFFKTNVREGTEYLYLPKGTTYRQLLDSLETLKKLTSLNSFERAAKFENLSANIKPGRYKIEKGMSNREIVRVIKYGWQTPTKLTIAGNIRTKEKLASILSRKISSDSLSILSALKDENFTDSLGFNSQTFLAMFLPNTYEIYWTISPKDLIVKLKKEYDKFWNDERTNKAKEIGLSPVEVVTLASIVSEESNIKEEQSKIAGVYMNRLRKGIPLQADPTIKFALNDPSIKRIRYKHLNIKSPYNTYRNAGLPPGPIVIPSLYTIDAVLNYERHNYQYFCARPSLDGSHSFSVTLAEHNRNARAYQKAISRL
ncbi:MAG: endolytic transglycosylase MltG [Rikenellaceae bacterium]